ncbi:hypothetical protein [Myxococcus sp. Y35]|uniref:hypothetical protein n=1 Tax=Pseudomyxococcus flavus TaxID=3115648 RepID=UPI003CE96E83
MEALKTVCERSVGPQYRAGTVTGLVVAGLLASGLLGWSWVWLQAPGLGSKVLGALVLLVVLTVCWVGATVGGLVAGGLALKAVVSVLDKKDQHKFGICPGSAGPTAHLKNGANLALTDWLHVQLNALAGRGPEAPPITVRELEEKGIHFKLVTSNLTLGQPYILPMRRGSRSFFFRKRDMVGLFPKPVVDALVKWGEANRPEQSVCLRDKDAEEFLRFPMGKDIPLVVATRLSLSFPVLLSAVRLYSLHDSAYVPRGHFGPPRLADLEKDAEEHWLSDGGITSNFPIHIFDAWVPLRPTFGITLYDSPLPSVLNQRERDTERKDPRDSVLLPFPRDFDKARPQRTSIQDMPGFLRAIFEMTQSYRDNAQAGMPSYRERIVQLFLEKNEGGLNLDMPPDVIKGIQAKGRCAAERLLERYPGTHSPHFSEHRWVRMQVLMSELERQLFQITRLFPGTSKTDWRKHLKARFDILFQEQLDAQRPGYEPWYRSQSKAWCDEARGRLEALLDLIETWDKAQGLWQKAKLKEGNEQAQSEGRPGQEDGAFAFFFADYPPRPEGVLKVTPDL